MADGRFDTPDSRLARMRASLEESARPKLEMLELAGELVDAELFPETSAT